MLNSGASLCRQAWTQGGREGGMEGAPVSGKSRNVERRLIGVDLTWLKSWFNLVVAMGRNRAHTKLQIEANNACQTPYLSSCG